MKGNTILITGGATGIGFTLAESLVNAGNKIIICGRREANLQEAQDKLASIETRVCDVTKEKERASLFRWATDNFPDLNMLINNAGILRMIDLKKGTQNRHWGEDEIQTNMVASIRLSAYFIPWLLQKKAAAIVNVSSGLGFVPMAAWPVYCATKAAIHSFTLSLRYQLKDTSVKVFEIVSPSINTELFKGTNWEGDPEHLTTPVSEVVTATLAALARDEYEISMGKAKDLIARSRTDPEQAFRDLNSW